MISSSADIAQRSGRRLIGFRPIYYLGCKTSMAVAIQDAIDLVDPSGGRVCDLFSGTGVVGAALAATRDVLSADIQEYGRVLASALLRPAGLSVNARHDVLQAARERCGSLRGVFKPLIDHENRCLDEVQRGNMTKLVELQESPPMATLVVDAGSDSALLEAHRTVRRRLSDQGLLNSPSTTVTRHFGGVYFSFDQAIALDAVLHVARVANSDVRDTLVAAALSVASQIVNSVGKQFAQPIRPVTKQGAVKVPLVRTIAKDRATDALSEYARWLSDYSDLPAFPTESVAVRGDYVEVLKEHGCTCSVVYADPPYTRDHYSRFYHVLETMSLGDEPEVSTMKKGDVIKASRGVYREDRHQSPFCIRSKAPEAFAELFGEARRHDAALVLSYSPSEAGDGTHPRVVSMTQIMDTARSFYSRVSLFAIEGLQHNQLNRIDLKLRSRDYAEVLVCCVP